MRLGQDFDKEKRRLETLEKTDDNVKQPSHYQGRHGMESIDVIRNFSACPEIEEGFYWGNVVKYVLRYHAKNGVEDLKKAQQYLGWLIEQKEKEVPDD